MVTHSSMRSDAIISLLWAFRSPPTTVSLAVSRLSNQQRLWQRCREFIMLGIARQFAVSPSKVYNAVAAWKYKIAVTQFVVFSRYLSDNSTQLWVWRWSRSGPGPTIPRCFCGRFHVARCYTGVWQLNVQIQRKTKTPKVRTKYNNKYANKIFKDKPATITLLENSQQHNAP